MSKKMSCLFIFILIVVSAFADFGNALEFDGVDDYVNCGSNSQIYGTYYRTIEAWAYVDSFNNGAIFQAGANDLGDGNDFSLRTTTTDNVWRVQLWGSGYDFDVTLAGSKDSWHHYALSYDHAASTVKLYYDGELAGSNNVSLNTGVHDFYIGRWRDDYFEGKIDDVRNWYEVRTQSEIADNMNVELTGNEANLITYWKLNESSGTNADDCTSISTQCDGTLYNMTNDDWIVSTVPCITNDRSYALEFDGSEDYITLNETVNLTTNYTIEMWFKTPVNDTQMTLFAFTYNTLHGILLEKGTDNKLRFLHRSPPNTSGGRDIKTTNTFTDNEWHHVAIIYEASGGDKFRIYVDGIFEAGSSDWLSSFTYPMEVTIGRLGPSSDSRYFEGQLDEIRIWSIHRDYGSIREYAHIPLSGSETNLEEYFQFPEGTGSQTQSSTGGNYAVLHNMEFEDWLESTIPFGEGGSYRHTINTGANAYEFSGTGTTINYLANSVQHQVCVSRINDSANINPTGADEVFDNQFWVINKFDGTTFDAELIFTTSEDLTVQDAQNPIDIELYTRETNSVGNWLYLAEANEVISGSNQAVFNSISGFSQFMICRTAKPDIDLDVSSHNFGERLIDLSKTYTLVINNTGTEVLNVSDISSDNSDFVTDFTNFAIPAESSYNITLTFTPSTAGAISGTLSIYSDDPDESPVTVDLSGEGIASADDFLGTALDFDGDNDYVEIPGNPSLNNDQFTVEFWVQLDNPNQWSGILDKGRDSNSDWFFLTGSLGSTEGVIFGVGNGSSYEDLYNTWNDTDWHHVAGTYDGTDLRLYVDGLLKGTRTITLSNTNNSIAMGSRRNGSWSTDCKLEEVRIWDVPRTEEELNQTKNTFLTGYEPGLVSYYQFNEAEDFTVIDLISLNDGTMHNMTESDRIVSDAPLSTLHQGTISSNTTWSDDEILVTGDITIDNGATLTINPGTTVHFLGDYTIYVQGRLLAEGTQADSITFTANEVTGWDGIRFHNTPDTNDSSKVSYCIFENSYVEDNTSQDNGGAIYIYDVDKLEIKLSKFQNNSGNEGGAVYCYNSTIKISNCIFLDNEAINDGGAIAFAQSGSPKLINCVVSGNTAGDYGGGIYVFQCASTITNCTITDNGADHGNGMAFEGSPNSTVSNSIVHGNVDTQIYLVNTSADPNFLYCNIGGGKSGFSGSGSGGNYSGTYTGCIDNESEFTDSANQGYSLLITSPCINGGNPSTTTTEAGSYDLAGNSRFYDEGLTQGDALEDAMDRIDMGAYEYSYPSGILPDNFVFLESEYYYSNYDLNISNGFNVEIQPGATLKFNPNAGFFIYGNLQAIGEPGNMISIEGNSPLTGFKGMNFIGHNEVYSTSSLLDYCIIEYGFGESSRNQVYGGNIYSYYYDELVIQNSIIRDGYAEKGGGIVADRTSLTMQNCVLYGNEAEQYAGAVYSYDSDVFLVNCTIADNIAGSPGSYGEAITFRAIGTHEQQITNCIVWGNGVNPITPLNSDYTDITYCILDSLDTDTGNISVDPEFIGSGDHSYNIQNYSYCINMGILDTTGLNLPTVDVLGNDRVFGHNTPPYDRIDIGAYEYQGLLVPGHFTASDGDSAYPGYVQLSWDYNPDYEPASEHFRIFRNNVSFVVVDPGILNYSDDSVIPGEVYTYYIQAAADGSTGNSQEDSGYIKPNGIISGTVRTANNNPVKGVKVSIDPSPGYCLEFGNPSELIIENPEVNMDYNFTIELWVKTLLNDVIILNKGNHNFSITSDSLIVYTDGNNEFEQTVTTLKANDGDWHHLALVNDYTNTCTKLYLDDVIIAEQSIYVFSGSSDSGFSTDTVFTGYLDDIRIWSTARDSSEVVEGMDIVAAIDENGLMGYWPLNEGNGNYFFDATDYNHNGTFSDCVWSDNDPGMLLGAFTDVWGEYIIRQINYGAATTFTVIPYKSGHIFQPEQRNVTLSTSNIAQNNVDFIDNSLIPIYGQILFQSTDCPVVGATIMLNGIAATPITITDEDGYYVMEVEHGTVCNLSVDYYGHNFDREWDLGAVTFPQTDIDFEDIYKTRFVCEVVGGDDAYPIGNFIVTLESVNGCYNEEISGQTWSSGGIIITNLPPLDFNVTVNPDTTTTGDPFNLLIDEQFENMKTDLISLTYADTASLDTLRFVWKAPLEIAVSWSDTLDLNYFSSDINNEFGFYVLPQNEWMEVEIQAKEDYSWNSRIEQITYLDDCEIVITDDVGTTGTLETAFEDTTVFVYHFAPYLPNMMSNGDRKYQNLLEFTIRDLDLDRSDTQGDYVLTEGIRPTESTYATTSPEIPFMVIHDPPGDGSSSSFTENSSHSVGMKVSGCVSREHDIFASLHLGKKFAFSTGCAAFSVEHELNFTLDFNLGLTMNTKQSESSSQNLTFSTSESYSTSSSDQIIGDGADVFVGGAVNLIWGVTNELSFDDLTQAAIIDTNVMISPDGFATVYIYTDNQIRSTVIPNLYAIEDTTSAELWQSYLDANDYNKENAVDNPNHPGNLSFNAGAGYTYEETTTTTQSQTVEFESTVTQAIGGAIGVTLDGQGVSGGYKFKTAVTIGTSSSETFSTTTTSSFTLADDDETSSLNFLPDYFTLDVKTDPVYGTPVFDLLSGASSCHWEPNTQPRDGVELVANTYTANDLLEGEVAVFLLELRNTTQTNEARSYKLAIKQDSNPGGAIVRVNGVLLEGAMSFSIPPGESVQAVMTVEQGPFAYEYDDLKMIFYAPCDVGYPAPDGHQFWEIREFDIEWEAPYSRVSIAAPADDWIVNQANNNILNVLLNDYDLTKPDFASVTLEYKHPADENWLPAFEIFRDSLEASHPHYINVPWDISEISDGLYEIRAGTTDSLQADYFTTSLSGVIDREPPEVMGVPEPADNVLESGDEISVTFTEQINCTDVNPNDITITITSTGQQIAFDADCYENTIELTPTIANFWYENETLEVEIAELQDLYGNVLETPITWEFYVNSNPVNWNVTKLDVIKQLGEPMTLTANLENNGGQHYSYVFTDYADSLYHSELEYHAPDWLSITPTSGQLIPLDSQEIQFEISDQIGFGHYETIIYAHTPMGNEAIEIEVDVLSNPPDWSITQFINFQSSMSIIGELNIEGDLSVDVNDIIGAFMQEESGDWICRGVANIEAVPYIASHPYQVFLTIYSDEEDPVRTEDEIIFRLWDNSDNKEYYQIDHSVFGGTLNYFANEVLGTPMNPVNLETVGDMVQDIPLVSGWTWFSTNLDLVPNTINDVLSSLDPIENDFVKDQSQYAQYFTDQWVGSLTTMNNTSMYKINMANEQILEIIGELKDPALTTISYNSGWNWIGYVPHVSMSVNQAMEDRNNVTGDFIKNQSGYAFFVDADTGWIGSLRFMNPGEGFMLYANASGSFEYPEYGSRAFDNFPIYEPIVFRDAPDWSVDPQSFEYTASLTAELQIGGNPAVSGNYLIGAFVGEECRGSVTPINVGDTWLYFLTVFSNTQNEEINLKVYDAAADEIIDPANSFIFTNDLILGTPSIPYELEIDGILGIPQNICIELSGGNVVISWDSVSGASSYKVFASDSPEGVFANVSDSGIFINNRWEAPVTESCKFYYVVASTETARGSVPTQSVGTRK